MGVERDSHRLYLDALRAVAEWAAQDDPIAESIAARARHVATMREYDRFLGTALVELGDQIPPVLRRLMERAPRT